MIKHNDTLNFLYLNNNQINNKGIIAISHALEDSKTLHHCYLYGNEITEEIQILVKKKLGDKVLISNKVL